MTEETKNSEMGAATTVFWARPLEELLEHQLLLLDAAKKAKTMFQSLDHPASRIDEVIEKSSQVSLFERQGVSRDVFKSLIITFDKNVENRIRQIPEELPREASAEQNREIYDDEIAIFYAALGNYCKNPIEFAPLQVEVLRWLRAPTPSTFVLQSLYVLCFAHFEKFLSSLTRLVLNNRDDILGELKRNFTWTDIRGIDSIENLKKSQVDQMVGGLLRTSMNEWLGWFEQKTKLTIPDEFRGECINLYDLRNLFAHEQSVMVSYMKVAKYGLVEHTCNALAELATRMVVSASTANKETEAISALASNLTGIEVGLLNAERWKLADTVCGIATQSFDADSSSEMHRVNSWIAKRQQGNFLEVSGAIASWDPAPLGPKFVLVKTVLTKDPATALQEVKDLIDSGELLRTEWNTWPLFSQLRLSPLLPQFGL